MSIAPSPAEQRVRKIKEQAVLEVYLREGPFWEAVRALRTKWEIAPAVGLPPADLPTPYPNGDHFDERYDQWQADVKGLALKLGRRRFFRAADWEQFAAACVLYDPPDLGLRAFAGYGGTHSRRPDGRDVPGEGLDDEAQATAAPLVRWVPNLAQRDLQMQRYYEGIISGLAERLEQTTGEDAAEAIEQIIRERGLEEPRQAAYVETTPGIFPDEHSTKAEVQAAHAAIQAGGVGGRPRINDLAALEMAYLHDHDNAVDPEDPRKRRWTYEKLQLQFMGTEDEQGRIARGWVERGRKLRAIRAKNLKEA